MIKNSTLLHPCIFYILLSLFLQANGAAQTMPVITVQEELDLELFETPHSKSKPFFYLLDNTYTLVGRKALKNILKNPLNSKEELEQRQEVIKELTDATLANPIIQALKEFKDHEPALYGLWQPQDPVQTAALDEFYFSMSALKKYNASPSLLSALQILNVGNMFFPLIEHAVLHFLISDKVKETYHIGCNHDHGHDHHHEHASQTSLLAYNVYNSVHFGLHLWNLKGLYDHIKQKAIVIKNMQENLISANRCIQSMRHIYNAVKDHERIREYMPHYSLIERLFDTTQQLPTDDTSAKLIELFSTTTFQGQASVWSNIGNVLAAYHLMSNAHTLRSALEFVGEIDAHTSIATLYTNHKTKYHSYTYAKFHTSDSPQATLINVWNPHLGNACCTHSMELGGKTMPNNSIITGDNAAGKSTMIKSMALTILLGQTFTIVPADLAYFTPFAKITTSIKHTDNIQEGASLFIAETLKAQALIETLENILPSTQFSFAIFDELFKSTNPEKGQKAACALISSLGKYPNSLALIATHYTQLTNLETEQPTVFRNYFSKTQVNDQGKTIFELIPGSITH